MPLPAAAAALVPAMKALAAGGAKKAALGLAKKAVVNTAKGAVKNKAKNFVTGKGRKKKGKKGKGGALVKSEGGGEEGSQGGGGGAIVPTTPIVGKYRVETPPQKPDEVGKPSKVSYETINNQLDSIVGLTEALKKTSMAKMKTATNRRKAERKAEEKAKQRDRENLLEKGAVGAIGAVGGAVSKAAPFDPLKFFTMIFLGSLLTWIMTHGSKITAFLKVTLALMNNFGKLVKAGFTALKNVFKIGFNAIKKLGGPLVKVGKALKNGIKSVGSGLSRAFGRIGNGIKNLAKGVINKIRAAGKILASPLKALQGLTGAEKKAVRTNKGLNKLIQNAGTGSQNLGTATRPPGTLSNATRSMRLRHGDEAARMYQGLIDNGMKPSKAAQYVNKSISSGKLTSAPLEGTLAGGKKGSQLLKGGPGRSANRVITKLGGKNALRATKALKKALGRIPIVGGLITLVVSLLGGDPVGQAMFKAGGAVLGGFLGSFIPIPVVGTLFGEIVGEYVGDLMYIATMGGGVDAVGQKLKDDLTAALSVGQKAMDWVGNGFGRLYEGIPKIDVPFVGKFPNPLWMINPMNLMEKLGLFHKAFFTDDPMEKGKEKTSGNNNNNPPTPTPVSAKTQQTLNTALPSTLNQNMSLGSQLKKNFGYKTGQEVKFQFGGSEYVARKTNQGWQFFDQKGILGNYRRIDTKGKNQQLVAAFIGSVSKKNPQTAPQTTQGGGSDFWTLVAVAAMEDSDGQARADVAQSIYNRKASGAYTGSTIRDLILQDGQYQPCWDYPTKNPSGKFTNSEWKNIIDAETAAAATGKSVQFIQQAAADIQNQRYQEEARKFVGGRTDFTNYSKQTRKEEVVRTTNKPNNYFGYDWNYTGNTVGGMPNFNTTASQPVINKMMTEQEYHNARVDDHSLPDTYEEYKKQFQPSVQPQQPVTVQTTQPKQQSHPTTPKVPGTGEPKGGALKTGLLTGPSAYIGGSAEYHIDTQIMKNVPMRDKIAMVDQMAAGYAKDGRVMEFSNPGVAGEIWDTNMSYDDKVKLLERVFAAHAHSRYTDRNSMDYYIPKKGKNRFDRSAEGAEILAPTVGGSTATYQSGGNYGNYLEIKDAQGNVIARTGHGDTRFGPKSGTVKLDGSKQVTPSPSPQQPVQVTPTPVPASQQQSRSIATQLPYEQTGGNTVILSAPQRSGGVMGGGRSAGTPVIMGSGDVVNSYYKSQLLGFLYKQG